ncbi:hypothetical protein NDU88_005487 [Pleurodeles waltl]|uniref:Uncharacterized protein n=1 Tax=Pleurodeles waltl TaxID=8319 RepID=A0AAV7PFV5_PLEWA|nr:hypothetical protein NDU88_005487 [Pleurodeles waltl]
MDSVSPTRCMFSQEYDLPPELKEIDPRLWAKGKNDVGIMDIDPIVIKIKPGARLRNTNYLNQAKKGSRESDPGLLREELENPKRYLEKQRARGPRNGSSRCVEAEGDRKRADVRPGGFPEEQKGERTLRTRKEPTVSMSDLPAGSILMCEHDSLEHSLRMPRLIVEERAGLGFLSAAVSSVLSKPFAWVIEEAAFDGMEVEQMGLMDMGVPEQLAVTLQASLRSSTLHAYARQWKAFSCWRLRNQVAPMMSSLFLVLQFLQRGAGMGLSVATL